MTETKCRIVRDLDSLKELLVTLSKADLIALDTETSSLDYTTGYLVGISFSVREGEGWYIPVGHDEGQQLPLDQVIKELKPVLEAPEKTYCIQNARFDYRWLKKLGINIPIENIHDTLLEVFSENNGPLSFGLKYLVKYFYNHDMVTFDDLVRGHKDKNIGHVLIEVAAPYASEDADYCLRLHNKTYEKVKRGIYRLECKLWPYVMEIEDNGFPIDIEFLNSSYNYLMRESDQIKELIYSQIKKELGYDHRINLSSFKQLGEVLFDLMKLPVILRTKTGPSTGEESMKELARQGYTICHNIAVYKSIVSTATNLNKTIREHIREDGKIHTSYNQAGASSGRFSSSAPNQQNIARPKIWKPFNLDGSTYEIHHVTRNAFVASEGYYLLELDYKAIEFIIAAYGANILSILEAYSQGLDVHANTVSETLGIPINQVTKEQRDIGKMQNYLVVYGGSPKTLHLQSGYDMDVCSRAIDSFFKRFPEFRMYADQIISGAKRTKMVVTHREIAGGRPQFVPELTSHDKYSISKGERAAFNRVIQGSAADYLKVGLIKTMRKAKEFWSQDEVRMVATTHDSQTWEIHKCIKPQDIAPVLSEAMAWETVSNYPKILVDAQIGLSWGSLDSYDSTIEYENRFLELSERHRQLIESLAEGLSPHVVIDPIIPPKKVLINLTNCDKVTGESLKEFVWAVNSAIGDIQVSLKMGDKIIERGTTGLDFENIEGLLEYCGMKNGVVTS